MINDFRSNQGNAKNDIFILLPDSHSLMASSDPTGLYIFGFILLLVLGLFAYSYLNKRLTDDKRKQLIKAFRASPVIAKNAPILVQGRAAAPDLLLPTTEEHVAFYCLFVLSRESSISDVQNGIPISIQGTDLNPARINRVKGFRFFETSGDFIVEQGETPYLVSVKSILAYFEKGGAMVSSLVGGKMKDSGLPEKYWNDAMNVQTAQPALNMLCGFDAPIGSANTKSRSGTWTKKEVTHNTTLSVVTVKSRIDSRIHYFNAGINLPPGILDLITKRGIVPEEKEEVIVVETFIPLNKEVYAFGTFDGERSVAYTDGTVQLSVSYTDPEQG
jgi:hypothetical protein